MNLYVPLDNSCERSLYLAKKLNANIMTDSDCLNEASPFYAEIKRRYNPLLNVQNYLIFDQNNEVLSEIPYFSLPFTEDNGPFERISKAFEGTETAESFECIFNYAITKDLRLLKDALSFEKKVCLTVFPLLDRLLYEHFNRKDTTELEREIISVFKNPPNAKKPVPINVITAPSDKQNLVLIHLESISNLIYNANTHLFPNLSSLVQSSASFTNYFSTATTTVMALCAIFYGNSMETDDATSYYGVSLDKTYNKNIFQQLSENGYKTAPFLYTSRSVTSEISDAKIWNDGTTGFESYFVYDDFILGIEDFITSNKEQKLAIFVDNEVSHCGVTTDIIQQSHTFEQKMEQSYKNVDDTIGRIFDCLEKNGLLDSTTILLYGDHGDDKWTRSMNNGFSHLIAPYMSSIHTPLFIYDKRLSPSIIPRLTSAIDLKYIMLHLLGIENNDKFEHSGKNVFFEENDFIYASNLYANQAVTEEIKSSQMMKLNSFSHIERKNKSYGVIDGEYCLIAGTDGMELFSIKTDPLNYNNLLNFFELDDNGNPVKFKNYGAWRGHFRIEIMNDRQIYDCLSHYFVLRRKLIGHIETRNELVKSKNPDALNLFDFSCMTKERPRNFIY